MNNRKKAIIETIIVSIIIPLIVWGFAVFYFHLIGIFRISFWVIVPASYTYIVFYRHHKEGRKFVLLSALVSSALQSIILYLLFKFTLSSADFSSEKGHLDGDAVLMMIVVFLEPLLVNILPLILWIGKMIVRFFKDIPVE